MSSAPYWGQLPEPSVARGAQDARDARRRPSVENQSADDYPPFEHYYRDLPPRRRSDHAVLQSTATNAQTESTFSPHSPAASALPAHGLAPRPPSMPRPAPQESAVTAHARASRAVAGQDYPAALPPASAAPGISRGPALSLRHPHGNGILPYTYPARADLQPPPSQARGEEMEPLEHYTAAYDTSHRPVQDVDARRDGPDVGQDAATQPRRPSDTGSQRRRMFANDRSPLQRLELTLDSMTKEEKRARVEAAEQRARQRAAMKAAESLSNQQPQTHDRRPSATRGLGPDAESSPAAPGAGPVSHTQQEIAAPRLLPTQHPPSPQHPSYGALGHDDNPSPQQATAPAQVSQDAPPMIPTRNLSFRERAARNETASFPDQEGQPAWAGPSDGRPSDGQEPSLARDSSQNLGKEPPRDGHRHEPSGAESSPVSSRPLLPAQNPQTQLLPLSSRNKELPPIPPPSPDNRDPQFPGDVARPSPWGPVQSMRRHVTDPIHVRHLGTSKYHAIENNGVQGAASVLADEAQTPDQRDAAPVFTELRRQDSHGSLDTLRHRQASRPLNSDHNNGRPKQRLYQAPKWLDEWKKGTTGTLSGALLDLSHEQPFAVDKNKAWWEGSGRGRGGIRPPMQRRAEAFEGEYDDTNAPTRFKPPLYLKCGPLLRYCGTRRERLLMRAHGDGAAVERETWRGSVMIVTKDSESSYEIAPMLRLFVQDAELLPPPPQQVDGELPPEYVDPIAGHPKLGRRGETLYVRPVEHLEGGRDLSRDETDDGLFEATRSPPEVPSADGSTDPPGSLARRIKAAGGDGEKMQKYKDVRGFRLHAERGCTFWRFNIEVELRDRQQRIAYRVNRGPCMAFWVPARGRTMNMMFYSCNGFGANGRPDELGGPDPMWRDVLNTHQTQPFHVMIGGGNQVYNDGVADECELLADWLDTPDALDREEAAFTADMQDELEAFYLERYCACFSRGLYGLATSQIPMVNMYDDHDILDGYGSYPHHHLNGPVFCGLGALAFKYYMLFQHQSILTETESSEPSWILGLQPGPYIKELSRSVFVSVGGKTALLAVDCRTERTESTVVREKSWEKMMNRLYAEIRRGQVDHLLVVSAVPIAFPRSVWLENRFTSRLVSPVKALGRAAVFGRSPNNVNGAADVLAASNGHWVANNHKRERSIIIEDLQDLAIDKSMRITILSGNVNMAAVGHLYSNPKLRLAKHRDPRYMPNIISSAIVNAPPTEKTVDVVSKRNKVHHFDKQTDEAMIPLFRQGVDGKWRSNTRVLPHRNWCSISQWKPGNTPPPTPPLSARGASRSPGRSGRAGAGEILRRLSSRRKSTLSRSDEARGSVRGPRPPVSSSSGLFRSLSRRVSSTDAHRPAKLSRSVSLGRGEAQDRGYLGTGWRTEDGQNGGFDGRRGGNDSSAGHANRPSGLGGSGSGSGSGGGSGGVAHDEFAAGDESYFSTRERGRAQSTGSSPWRAGSQGGEPEAPAVRPFFRTPTGLSAKQMRQADKYAVDLEGGLDVTLNVEVNAGDAAGITVPYRLLVPRLQYEYNPDEDDLAPKGGGADLGGLRRLLSLRKKPAREKTVERETDGQSDEDEDDDGDEAWRR